MNAQHTCELRHFELFRNVSFDASEEDFTLSGFEAVYSRRQRSFVVRIGKLDKLFVDKLGESDVSRPAVREKETLPVTVLTHTHDLVSTDFLYRLYM